MLRDEWKALQNDFYHNHPQPKGFTEMCQDFHDKEIAALNAKHAAEIAALTKPCSPQLIVPNPYSAYHEPDSRRCFDEGFAAGIKAATAPEKVEPVAFKNLTEECIRKIWNDATLKNGIVDLWVCCVRAVISADRALQYEQAPLSVTGRWFKFNHGGEIIFVEPVGYAYYSIEDREEHLKGVWLTDEETRTFPCAR